jgi:hypothetical protein
MYICTYIHTYVYIHTFVHFLDVKSSLPFSEKYCDVAKQVCRLDGCKLEPLQKCGQMELHTAILLYLLLQCQKLILWIYILAEKF